MNDNEFKITMAIQKSFEATDGEGQNHMYVRGVASGVGLDRDGERMAHSAIDAFKKAIDEGIVLPNNQWSLIPLRSGHRNEWDDVLGYIVKAEIDDDYNLWIEAELDETSTTACDLYKKLDPSRPQKAGRPLQLGLSIGGKIKKASREWNAEMQKSIKVIEDIALKEISVVGCPAFPTAYVEALTKSVNWDEIPYPQEEALKELEHMSNVSKAQEEATPTVEEVEVVEASEAVQAATTEEVSTKSEEAEVAEATSEQGEEATKNADPASADLVSLFQGLSAQVALLSEQVSSMKSPAVPALADTGSESVSEAAPAAESEKSKADADSTDTTKAEGDLEERIMKAVASAIAPLVAELAVVKSTVEEVANEPVDKSASVRKAKDDETDVITKFVTRITQAKEANTNGYVSPIGEAVRLAVGE